VHPAASSGECCGTLAPVLCACASTLRAREEGAPGAGRAVVSAKQLHRARRGAQAKELKLGTVPPGATLVYTLELASLTKVRAASTPRCVVTHVVLLVQARA